MAHSLSLVVSAGPIVFIAGLLLAVVCGLAQLASPGPRRGPSLTRFALLSMAIGAVAFVAGTAIGIAVFCSAEPSGDLCGLGGFLGVGPILAGVGMGGHALFWLKRARRAV